jgi:diguanylate cyclase (GGDEF)-like protein
MDIKQFLDSFQTLPKVGFLDPLTAIPNRYFLDNFLKNSNLRDHQIPLHSIYLIDLDYFKEINDLFGYIVGDKILCQVALRLNELATSEGGIVIRLGGDEFAILIDKQNNDDLLAQNILKSINEVFIIDTIQYFVNASIGYIANPIGMSLSYSLIKKIEFSLQLAKKSGGNQAIGFHHKLQNKPFISLTDDDSRNYPIKLSEFYLDFQAQLNHLQTLQGFEGFLRWNHPSKGVLSAIDFLYLIYDHEYILIFGDFVLHKTFEALDNMHMANQGMPISLAINMSPIYFQQNSCSEILDNYLQKKSVDSPRLIIEFSANDLPKNLSKFNSLMNKYALMGIEFCLEDIGDSEVALNELLTLPIHQLKVDAQLLGKKNSTTTLKSILSIAQVLNVPVIAKNVETKEQYNLLQELGIFVFQGNLLAAPTTLDAYTNSDRVSYL